MEDAPKKRGPGRPKKTESEEPKQEAAPAPVVEKAPEPPKRRNLTRELIEKNGVTAAKARQMIPD